MLFIKQQLKIVGEGDEEKVLVNKLCEESEEFDINSPEIVQNILKQGAKMEVNTTELEVDSIINDRVKTQKDEAIVSNNLKKSLENNKLKENNSIPSGRKISCLIFCGLFCNYLVSKLKRIDLIKVL